MNRFTIRAINPTDHRWVAQFITERWGAKAVVAHSTMYHPQELPDSSRSKMTSGSGWSPIIWTEAHEIVTLDSLRPNCGIGIALIDAVKNIARKSRCNRMWLITTNDNLRCDSTKAGSCSRCTAQ
jgi:hypothetical protein